MSQSQAQTSALTREDRILLRYVVASILAAVATIALKTLAAVLTGSVGFLSDAMESGVNLVAAVVALLALLLAARPPDRVHEFGHGNAEYLSAGVEGGMVFLAAGTIVWTAMQRLVDPTPIEQAGVGLALSTAASLINLAVGLALVRAGSRYRSVTLVADGKHLLTDVWTSAGVLVGIALVAIFDWVVLDPIVALLVGVNILRVGYQLLRRSVVGLLDAALPDDDVAAVIAVLDHYRAEHGVDFGPLRTRESGRQRFVYVLMTVPGSWTVEQSHALTEDLEIDIERALPTSVTFVHVEPLPVVISDLD
jgi:cation diffusion facilitator family transporter